MPTLGEAVGALEARLFVGRAAERSAFAGWLGGDETTPAILNVSGPGGVGKSTLLRAFRRDAAAQGRAVLAVDGRQQQATPEGRLAALGGGTLDQVHSRLQAERPLLVLDTFEELADLTRYLQESFLPGLPGDARLVIAGRYPLGAAWGETGPWAQLIQPLPLAGLASTEARAYLAQRGIEQPTLVEQILGAAGGHPLALSLAADLAVQFGVRDFTVAPEWHLAVRGLVERLLRDAQDPALVRLLEAAAVVRQFDQELLAALAGPEAVSAAFGRLCGLSLVRPASGGLQLHDDVRRILAEDLRWRRPKQHGELRRRALGHYRERMRTATTKERELLLADRLFLWEDAFVRTLLFADTEPGDIWVAPGRSSDHPAIRHLWIQWLDAIRDADPDFEYDSRLESTMLDLLLAYPRLRLRIAHDRDGQVLGYTSITPVTGASLDLLDQHPAWSRLVRPHLSRSQLLPLLTTAQEANIFCLMHVAAMGPNPDQVTAALMRNYLGVLTLEGMYFCMTPFAHYKQLVQLLGFELVPEARSVAFGSAYPVDGYVLDLRGIGVEAWLDAIVAGRRPPKALRPEELERELQFVLLHWHDDSWLLQSPLTELAAARVGAGTPDAAALRAAMLEALERARAGAPPALEPAYRALELAYLQRGPSHERIAERLAVSRATLFRLLKRGVQGLAEAWRRT